MNPFMFIDKRTLDPPNTPIENKKYVFIDEILRWLNTNEDKQAFTKITSNIVEEQDYAKQWERASTGEKTKLFTMLSPDYWTSEVPKSVMELLGYLIQGLPTSKFANDAKELHYIYSTYCNSSSKIHVDAAKIIFQDICKEVGADIRTKMFNIMLDDLFNNHDHHPLMYFNWDRPTIKQLTTRLINLWTDKSSSDYKAKFKLIYSFARILEDSQWPLVENVEQVIDALFPFFSSSDNVDNSQVGDMMRDVWFDVFRVFHHLGKAQFNKVTKMLKKLIETNLRDGNIVGTLSAIESLLQIYLTAKKDIEPEFMEKHAKMIVRELHSENFHIRNISHELIAMFSDYVYDEDELSRIWSTLASRYRSLLAIRSLKQINDSWGRKYNTKANVQRLLENCFHFERDHEQIPNAQTDWERYYWFNLNIYELATKANRSFLIEQSQLALQKLVQVPLPCSIVLPLYWICIRNIIKHKQTATVPDLQDKINAYLEFEGQRRLYTAINIFHILKDLTSRLTKAEISSLLNSVYNFIIDFPETPYSLDLEVATDSTAMNAIKMFFTDIPAKLSTHASNSLSSCFNVSDDRLGYQLFYLAAHTNDIKLKNMHPLFESQSLRLKHIPVLVLSMCKYVPNSVLEKNLRFVTSVFGKLCNVNVQEVLNYKLPEGVYIGMPFVEQYYGSVFIGLEAVFSRECGEKLLSLVPSIFGKNGVVERVKAAYFTYPMQRKLAKLLNAYIHCVGKEKAMPNIQHFYDELKQNSELRMLLDKPKFEWQLPKEREEEEEEEEEEPNPTAMMMNPFTFFMNNMNQ